MWVGWRILKKEWSWESEIGLGSVGEKRKQRGERRCSFEREREREGGGKETCRVVVCRMKGGVECVHVLTTRMCGRGAGERERE